MKIKSIIVTGLQTLASIAGVFAGVFVVLSLFMMGLDAIGFESPYVRQSRERGQAICAAKGGQWIVNPHSYIPHRIYGQGCDLDYQARAAK